MLQDVDYEGYEEIPKQIFQGYTIVAEEMINQVCGVGLCCVVLVLVWVAPLSLTHTHTHTHTHTQLGDLDSLPTHAFVNAGVGGFASAMCGHLWERLGEARPRFVCIEPRWLFARARVCVCVCGRAYSAQAVVCACAYVND